LPIISNLLNFASSKTPSNINYKLKAYPKVKHQRVKNNQTFIFFYVLSNGVHENFHFYSAPIQYQ